MERDTRRRRRAHRPPRSRLGNQLGAMFCLAGFVVVWIGWNGAASYDISTRQFPYLISGGIVGLCLVIVGVGLLVVQSQRVERARLEENLASLSRILETLVGASGGGAAESRPLPSHEYEPDTTVLQLPG